MCYKDIYSFILKNVFVILLKRRNFAILLQLSVLQKYTSVTLMKTDNTPVVLADNVYDKLCRLSSKTVMGEKISYTYNIKDWITQISSNNFIQQLTYHTSGNIGTNNWRFGSASNANLYSYAYDALGRICNAAHIISGTGTTRSLYSTSYCYDRNGNITRLYRYAPMTDGPMGVMDRLDMAYDGNHLISAINSSNAGDFMDCVRYEGENDMEYDENGCLTKDLDKKISSIRYNSLNLPTTINFRRDYYNTYMYNAKGQKVREVKHMPLFELAEMNHLSVDISSAKQGLTEPLSLENESLEKPRLNQAPPFIFSDITYTINYSDNLVFEDSKLKRILLDEGFIYFENNNTPTYHYYLKDHQGNNRVVVNAVTKQKEESYDYYPFGKQFGDYHTGNIHPYRYNGKELDKINGLDWYCYGARMLEPAWGRFTTPDPLAEDYYSVSPYAYCLNNPIKNYASTSMLKKIRDEVINSGTKKSYFGIYGHSSKTNTNTKVAKIARARKSNEKTDVKIKQTTADAIQQFSLGKVAGAIVDFGRGLFDW